MQLFYFISILETILEKIPIDYPTIVIGDFNVNMLTNTSQSKTLQNMNKYKFKNIILSGKKNHNTQIDHIWINVLTQQCHFGSTKAYWIDHKPIFSDLNYKIMLQIFVY